MKEDILRMKIVVWTASIINWLLSADHMAAEEDSNRFLFPICLYQGSDINVYTDALRP